MRKKQNYCTVSYRANYKQDEDGYKLPVIKKVKVRKDGITRYCNCLHLLSKISARERLMLDYLSEHMDSSNAVYITSGFKYKMNKFFKKNCDFSMADQTIRTGLSKLKKLGLLLSFHGRGTYLINPKYLFNGMEANRKILISSILNDMCFYPELYSEKTKEILSRSDQGMF